MKNSNPRLRLPAAALLWFAATCASAQTLPLPVADINTTVAGAAPDGATMVKVNNGVQDILVISIDEPLTGHELWKGVIQDNTVNLSVLKDVITGSGSSAPEELTTVGNQVFFTALGSNNKRNLWVTNGETSGTRMVLAAPTGAETEPTKLLAFKNAANVEQLIFEGFGADPDDLARNADADPDNNVNIPSLGRELWKSDGTALGTRRLTNINTINGGRSDAANFLVHPASSTLYFTADSGPQGRELWKINFSNTDGAVMIKDLEQNTGTPFPAGLNPELTAFSNQPNSSIYFVADTEAVNGAEDAELWVTNGVVNGTMSVVHEIRPGSGSSTPRSIKVMTIAGQQAGTYLYFTADDGVNGRELWRSNGLTGSQKETILLKNIRTGALDSFETIVNPDDTVEFWDQLTVVGETLFFVSNEGGGAELYRSNGRTGDSNTVRVQDIVPGAGSSNPRNLTPFDTKLVFTAHNATGNTVLYFCQAVSGGVTVLKDFAADREVSHFTRIGSQLYFLVDGAELWKTDGATGAATVMVKNFRSGTAGSNASSLSTTSEGITYFSATDGSGVGKSGHELWKTDGTQAGTAQVANIRAGVEGSMPQFITQVGDKIFFSADSTGSNRELWMTDGTLEGTELVLTKVGVENVEINTGGASEPQHLVNIDGTLYFSAANSTSGREPWRSDGTPEGTKMLANLVGAGGSSNPENFIKFKTDIYFISSATGEQARLRKVSAITGDSSPAIGSVHTLRELTVFGTGANNKIYFSGVGTQGSLGRELWSSDGTPEGTALVKDIHPTTNSAPSELTVAGNFLYFSATDGVTGNELWRTNGTLAGTVLVRDINTQVDAPTTTQSSAPQQLTEAGGKIFFTADNGINGRELWVSTGTSAGTVMVKDIVTGSGSPDIQNMRNVAGVLCFSADDGVNGRELWISDGTAAGTVMINDLTGPAVTSSPANFTELNGQLLYTAADRTYGNELYLFAIGAKIQLEQPLDTILQAGSAVDFTSADFKPVTLNLSIRNAGIATLVNIKPLISGINASEFTLVTPKAATTLIQGATTPFGVKFTPKEGGLRTATLSIMSSDTGHNPFILQLHGTADKDPYISDHPDSMMRKAGQSAEFEAEAVGTAPLTLQWKKGAGSIAGAVSTAGASPATTGYQIASVTLKDAGAYSLSVKNGVKTALSNAAELGVVEEYAEDLVLVAGVGKAATFKVNAAGNQLTYQWLKNNVPLSNDARVTGATTKTMVVKSLVAGDTDLYTCRVTNPGGSQIGGNTQLNIFTAAPEITTPQGMPNSVIGGDYKHQITLNGGAPKAALTYSAKNLPPGLKIDSKTGKVTGRPTKAGTYEVTLTATNTLGSGSATASVNIEDLPGGVEGIYTGVVEHKALINKHLGGRLDLTVTKLGAYSGSLTLGATKLPIKGAVNIFRLESATNPQFQLDLKPAVSTGLPALKLNVQIDRLTGLLVSSSVTTTGETATITGWRNVDAATAAHYEGYYTFGLSLGAPEQVGGSFEDKVPQGWSFGSFKSVKGKVTLTGRTADGDKITGSSYVGIGGKIVVFQTMYTPLKGSLAGSLTVDPVDTGNATDNVITSADDIKWVRPADVKSKTRSYIAGFGMPGTPVEDPVSLEAIGSIYVKPTGLVLGLTEPVTQPNVDVDFLYGGISTTGTPPDVTVTIGTGNKITQATPAPAAATKLASITTATGAFTGSFALADAGVPRKVTFQGILVKDGSTEKGVGFFALPELPEGAEKPTATPILSGSVELKKAQ